MDKGDFLWFYALCKQRRLGRFVKIECAVIFGCALVTEDKLGQFLFRRIMVYLCHVPGAYIEFGVRVIRQGIV